MRSGGNMTHSWSSKHGAQYSKYPPGSFLEVIKSWNRRKILKRSPKRAIFNRKPQSIVQKARLQKKNIKTNRNFIFTFFSGGGPRSVMATTPDSHAGSPGFKSLCRPTKIRSPSTPITRLQVAKMRRQERGHVGWRTLKGEHLGRHKIINSK